MCGRIIIIRIIVKKKRRIAIHHPTAVGVMQLELPLQSNSRHHPTPLFWYLGFHGNATLNFINTPKASTHYGEYSYNVS
jgi:hypothetical protein